MAHSQSQAGSHIQLAAQAQSRISLERILYLTDFSQPSEAALPYAVAIARRYDARILALHILTPPIAVHAIPEIAVAAIDRDEQAAQLEMARLESELTGVAYETQVIRSAMIWPAVRDASASSEADLLVLGTHGRTGAQKFLMGSVAEEIFRRSAVPVLTIGPAAAGPVHTAARFRRILFAADFSSESLAAAPYAFSFAQEDQARLVLIHVISESTPEHGPINPEMSVANGMHRLHELVPAEASLWCRPEAVIEFGKPAARILAAAEERAADLIVLGVRDAGNRIGPATHLERATAHQVVAHAACPVLTIRG
jgi:nucleotide-binding universal stress UspA family protein